MVHPDLVGPKDSCTCGTDCGYHESGCGKLEEKMDNWKHRSEGMRCRTCMFYVPKLAHPGKPERISFGRCRRHAPTLQGWPAVFQTDWCGDHKVDEEKI